MANYCFFCNKKIGFTESYTSGNMKTGDSISLCNTCGNTWRRMIKENNEKMAADIQYFDSIKPQANPSAASEIDCLINQDFTNMKIISKLIDERLNELDVAEYAQNLSGNSAPSKEKTASNSNVGYVDRNEGFDWIRFLEVITNIALYSLILVFVIVGIGFIIQGEMFGLIYLFLGPVLAMAYASLNKVIIGIAKDVKEIKNNCRKG